MNKKSRQKEIKIEIAFFLPPLAIPRVAHWIISSMLHISVITSRLRTDTYMDELVDIYCWFHGSSFKGFLLFLLLSDWLKLNYLKS